MEKNNILKNFIDSECVRLSKLKFREEHLDFSKNRSIKNYQMPVEDVVLIVSEIKKLLCYLLRSFIIKSQKIKSTY